MASFLGGGRVRSGLVASTAVMARVSSQIVSFVLTLVAARFLVPTQFGIFALAAIATTLIRTMLYSGAFERLLKAPDPRRESSECLVANLGVAALLSLIAVAGIAVARAVHGPGLLIDMMLALLPSSFVSAVVAWQESLLLRTKQLLPYYGATLCAQLCSMVLAIALFFLGWGTWALVAQVYAGSFINGLLYRVIERPLLSDRFSGPRFVEVVRWSSHRYGAVLIQFASTYAADILLGVFFSPAATGLYRASNRLASAVVDIVGQPARLLGATMFSARAALGKGSGALWPGMLSIAGLVGWAALGSLAAGSASFVPFVLGPQWHAAAPIVTILCVGRAFAIIDAVVGPALVASDQGRPIFYIQSVIGAALVVSLLVTAPLGIVPATLAVAIVSAIGSALLLALALRRLPDSAAALMADLPVALGPALVTSAAVLVAQYAAIGPAMSGAMRVSILSAAGVVAWLMSVAALHRRVRRLGGALADAL